MTKKIPITVAHGDGIGPEIMGATLKILEAAGAALEIDTIEIGEAVYNRGQNSGIEPSAWDSLRRTKVFLKAPITTPQGGGFKSLNVTVRKTLGLFANVRPCASFHPFIETKHPKMDVVIVRENEEDLYAGIEYRLSPEIYQTLKLITVPGCEKIVRYAFDYARQHNRKKVTCFTKDNIMKFTDGLFHKVFDRIAAEYPDIENEHWIVDIGAAKLADSPEAFDVLVMPNLYGDILSDVAAQIAGSVGIAGSANIGDHCAMFEAIHGSAPRRAGQNLANPSGLLMGAVMMLVHIGQAEAASRVHNAWLRTIEEGVHTYDIYTEGQSRQKVGTKEFADAVIARLGKLPETLRAVEYRSAGMFDSSKYYTRPAVQPKDTLVGADFYITDLRGPNELAAQLKKAECEGLTLQVMSNRGVSVWPEGMPETFLSDQYRCRFVCKDQSNGSVPFSAIAKVMAGLDAQGLTIAKMECLRNYDGVPGYSHVQGQ